jgi:AcrR family transcriptional regulator
MKDVMGSDTYDRPMPRRPDDDRVPRATARLSREAILAAGIALADRDGLDQLSMRRLGQELGVNPMSIYHHLRDKEALLHAMVDAVVAGIAPDHETTAGTVAWTEELRSLVRAARCTMHGHPWAVRVLQQHDSPSPAMLRHIDRVLGTLRRGGCSLPLSHHALHLLGSRILGFSQDLFDDSPANRADPATLATQFRAWADAYPHVVELAAAASHGGSLGGCDDDAEFDFALDLLLEGLERRRLAESGAP